MGNDECEQDWIRVYSIIIRAPNHMPNGDPEDPYSILARETLSEIRDCFSMYGEDAFFNRLGEWTEMFETKDGDERVRKCDVVRMLAESLSDESVQSEGQQ